MTDPSEAAAILARSKPRAERRCTECGAAFVAVSQARYCGNTCAQRARRAGRAKAREKKPG